MKKDVAKKMGYKGLQLENYLKSNEDMALRAAKAARKSKKCKGCTTKTCKDCYFQ